MGLIKRFPIEDYVITVYITKMNYNYSLNRDGTVIRDRNAVDSDFSNARINLRDCVMLGKLGTEAFDTKGKYLTNIGFDLVGTPSQTITEFLQKEDIDVFNNIIWVIVPKPNKKLTGIKYELKFNLLSEDYQTYKDYILPVYMTPITEDVQDIKFKLEAPKWLYKKAMENPNEEARPKTSYIESSTLSSARAWLEQLSKDADIVYSMQKDSNNYKKVLFIDFGSGTLNTRDNLNFAFTGEKVTINFKYCVAYEYVTRNLVGERKYFSWLGFESGNSHIIDFEKYGRKRYFTDKPSGIMISWTQEREDFLKSLQESFINISDKLNHFLKDLNEDKLELLISNKTKLLS